MYSGIDFTQPETRAALQLAERAQIHGFTVIQAAELITTALYSPWFAQLQHLASDDNPALREGAKTLITILHSGYNPTAKTWFYLPALYRTPEAVADAHAKLALFFHTLHRLRRTGTPVSPIFDAFGELLFGREHLAIVMELAATGTQAFPTVFQAALRQLETTP
jgi:hypothetical protein